MAEFIKPKSMNFIDTILEARDKINASTKRGKVNNISCIVCGCNIKLDNNSNNKPCSHLLKLFLE
jgi:hypothetical protein